MRLLNGNISAEANRAHDLWFAQRDIILLTKPLTLVFEITSPDNTNLDDYTEVIDDLECAGYTITGCTRFPSDICGYGYRVILPWQYYPW